jgi:hypothetical protein
MTFEFLALWNAAVVYMTLNVGYDNKLMRKYKQINSLAYKLMKI